MKLILTVLFLLTSLSGSVVASASSCVKEGVVVVEITRRDGEGGELVKINGKQIGRGKELTAVREACALRMVVLLSPKATIGDLLNFGFIASKSGFDEKSKNYLLFAHTTDKTRMTYLKTMAVVKYSTDPVVLKRLASSPPTENNFF